MENGELVKPIEILLVEDNPGDAKLIQEMIKETMRYQFKLACVDCLSDSHSQVAGCDVVLLDLGLPDSEGLETVRSMAAHSGGVPIVVLTGLMDEVVGRHAIQEGAQDYIIKGHVNGSMLVRSINYAIERKRTEKVLQEQYATLHSILESTNALIFSIDTQYRYTSFNNAYSTMMHNIYGADIQIGHSILDYMAVPEDLVNTKQNFDKALAGNHHTEISCSSEDTKSCLYFEVSRNPIKADDGSIIGVAVLCQDITEHKRSEEELSRYRQELEVLVQERTAELKKKNEELENFNRLFVGRELRMVELKEQIANYEKEIAELKKAPSGQDKHL